PGPDTAPRHGVLRGNAATVARRPMGAVRHASSGVGTAARGRAILRAVLRDVAPVDPKPRRPQVVARLGAPGPRARSAVADTDADPDAAHDAARRLPRRARAARGPDRWRPAVQRIRNISSVTGTLRVTSSSRIDFVSPPG